MGSRFVCAALLLVACGGPPTPSVVDAPHTAEEPSARYPIRVDRAEHAGQRWRERAIGRESHATELLVQGGDLERSEESATVELTAIVEVLEADDAGRQLRMSYTIEQLTMGANGDAPSPLLRSGSVVTVVRGAAPVIEIDGGPPDPAVVEALDIVLELDEDRDDDAVFGSSEPRAVGETWAVDAGALRRTLPDAIADVHAVRGEVRVDDQLEVEGEPCLRLRGYVTFEGFAIPGLPPGASARSRMHSQFEGTFPIDTRRRELDERIKVTTDVEVRTSDREVHSRETREVRRSFESL